MDKEKNYRIITRQSELAVRVVGKTQVDLFVNAAFALFDVITDTEVIEAKERMQLEVEGTDRDDLLVNWLRELLYLYQGSAYLLREFSVQQMNDTLVKAEVSGENEVNPTKLERWLRFLGEMAPDILDVVIKTLTNPLLGISETAHKIAARASKG